MDRWWSEEEDLWNELVWWVVAVHKLLCSLLPTSSSLDLTLPLTLLTAARRHRLTIMAKGKTEAIPKRGQGKQPKHFMEPKASYCNATSTFSQPHLTVSTAGSFGTCCIDSRDTGRKGSRKGREAPSSTGMWKSSIGYWSSHQVCNRRTVNRDLSASPKYQHPESNWYVLLLFLCALFNRLNMHQFCRKRRRLWSLLRRHGRKRRK